MPTDNEDVLFGNALQYHVRGDLTTAADHYKKILRVFVDHAESLHHLGLIYLHHRQYEDALSMIQRSCQVKPKQPNVLSNLGYCLNILTRYEEALEVCEEALAIDSGSHAAWTNLGNSQRGLGFLEKARFSHEKALTIFPDNPRYLYNLGSIYFDLGDYEQAKVLFEKCLAIDKNSPEAQNNLAASFIKLGVPDAALNCLTSAIKLKPDYAEAWDNQGNALNNLKRYEDALNSYERAIELKPDYAEAWYNRGNTLTDLMRYEEALTSYDRAIQLVPEYADAWYNMALLQLKLRQFAAGFNNFRWRWKTADFKSHWINSALPLCNPSSLKGRVLLWAEQGLGDEIFYAGMLPLVNDKCSGVTLSLDKRLHAIFKRSFPSIELIDREKITLGKLDACYQSQAPIGDLGYLLKLNEEDIRRSRKPFLLSNPERVASIKLSETFTARALTCGISWRSSNKYVGDEKSLSLEQLVPLLQSTQFTFINLQYGDVDPDVHWAKEQLGVNIHQIEELDLFNDIEGLLALIASCDIVVTTSSVTAHLAGSIGKRCCVLVPFSKGKIWYWHLNDDMSFWYPSIKVFYQDHPSDWSDTVLQASKWLTEPSSKLKEQVLGSSHR
jgi:tetratricopeptide (TPR) repeat protein